MSGPIVRKYGFPNFDDIFGKRDLQHGVDEGEGKAAEKSEEAAAPASPKETPRTAGKKPGDAKSKG